MRNRHICPKCDHDEILRIAEIADEIGDWQNRETVGRATTTLRDAFSSVALRLARFSAKSPFGRMRATAAGLVRAYACRRCGYTELYTDGVDKIPIDGKHVTLLRGRAAAGPFR